MPYVWLWLLIAQLLLLLPNRWKVSLHCREGSKLSAHANACVMCVFHFSRVFFSTRSSFILFLQQRSTPAIILLMIGGSVPNHGIAATLAYVNRELTNTPAIILLMIGGSVPNHGIAAILAYVNRELTNTLVFLMSPRGPYGREEEHAMRYYSGGFGQRFLATPSALGRTWLLG